MKANTDITTPPVEAATVPEAQPKQSDPAATLAAAAEAALAAMRGEAADTEPRDISRKQAAKIIVSVFGPRGFARKKTKTNPGQRRQVAVRRTGRTNVVDVIGTGRTWLEALKDAAETLDRNGVTL